VRLGVLAAIVLAAASFGAAQVARADGDPASDILYFQDVYYPFTPKPSGVLVGKLRRAAALARAKHRPVKVAVIWSATDLGSVPDLFGTPQTYARFLAAELGGVLTGPLLIVMPSGFGVYARTGQAEELQLIASVPVHASTVNALMRTAVAGVEKLASIQVKKTETIPPRVRALPAKGRLGRVAALRFRISDNSGRARALVRVYGRQYALFATLKMPTRNVRRRGSVQTVKWHVPVPLGPGLFKFCVLAIDRAGNSSATKCAKLQISK
jgi:hypothetical protein